MCIITIVGFNLPQQSVNVIYFNVVNLSDSERGLSTADRKL